LEINDLTYKINGAIYEVNRVLGSGFLEKVYENALLVELRLNGLCAENQIPIKVQYKNENVGEYFADIIVENQVILEIKAIHSLDKIHEAQILNYLKATGYKVGLLANSEQNPPRLAAGMNAFLTLGGYKGERRASPLSAIGPCGNL
jgi:GxxExxY protein